ncbi:GAF domain-containing protein [Spirulina sp. 06S082]|uniref:GAF domain-containing protein n=1 Tax=Spirulina sp. 06S082 TaxID=3110248 RepID=UPI002B1FB05B|nr:GAF domain-containing protein [Spirulina sp. 06S082]MEA5472052.1 GAF domain-containing protein [Spirulina sp. 06S082]
MTSNSFSSPTQDAGIPLTPEMLEGSHNYKKMLGLVLEWTGKEPFLTQILFKMVLGGDEAPIFGEEEEWVNTKVRGQILKNWDKNPHLKPLWNIRDRILKSKDKKNSIKLLKFYREIVKNESVFADNSAEQKELRLLGLIVQQRGRLKVHNKIYEEVFDLDWIDRAIAKLEANLEPDDDEFLHAFSELERKLLQKQGEILIKIESGDADEQTVGQPLYETLRDLTGKVGELVGADRTSIFLLNDEKTELWSLVAEDESGQFLDIHVRVGQGIAGLVAKNKQVIHIADNVYEDPRSRLVKESDKKFNYQTKNILAFPILNDDLDIVAVVQLLNKIVKKQGDPIGFTHQDLERLAKCVIPIRGILETCQSCYEGIKKAQATAALAKATRSLNQVNLDTEMILERVMGAAKELLNADRATLWLVDGRRGDLWTRIPGKGEIRCPIGVGFAGQVAHSRTTMAIPFDLYEDPNAENAKKTDAQTLYRTCSLLCMPVLAPDGELVGVSQLVNKRKSGMEGEYDPNSYPAVPDFFKASFDKNDLQSMEVFNERVGAILQFAKTHETLKESSHVEPKEAVQQTLSLFSNLFEEQQDSRYNTLYSLLNSLTVSMGKFVSAEYSHIFFVDADKKEVWSLAFDPKNACAKEFCLPADRGIAAKLLTDREAKKSNKVSQIKDRFVRVGLRKDRAEQLQNILLFPVIDSEGNYVAILRLLNKRQSKAGFTTEDVAKLKQKSPDMLPILQAFQSFRDQ